MVAPTLTHQNSQIFSKQDANCKKTDVTSAKVENSITLHNKNFQNQFVSNSSKAADSKPTALILKSNTVTPSLTYKVSL